MANPEKCPGCGAAANRHYEGHTWYECGSMRCANGHFIDGAECLRNQLAQEKAKNERLHPRVLKLAARDEPFIVIGCREPYFADAYKMIRAQEREQGTWTAEDERCFEVALIAWACAREAAAQPQAEGEEGAKP